MLRVFQIASNVTATPVSIIASDDRSASKIFSTWVERHQPGEQVERPLVRLVGANELALQPQLVSAVESGVEGVTYWCGHRLGYYVAAPGEVQLGALGPATTLVKCFEVDDEADVMLVFAHTSEHARELFDVWNRLAYGDGGENATVEGMSPWLLRGPQVTLREDMDVGLTGVGSVCEDGFWRIFPADYEPTVV